MHTPHYTTNYGSLLTGHHLIGQSQDDLSAARRKLHPHIPERSWQLTQTPHHIKTILADQDVTEFPVLLHVETRAVLNLEHTERREVHEWLERHS